MLTLHEVLITKFGIQRFLTEQCRIDVSQNRQSFIFNCPFHDDRNPSFAMYKNTGRGKCFSCGHKGDLIAIYAAKHSLSNRDAYLLLKQKYHRVGSHEE